MNGYSPETIDELLHDGFSPEEIEEYLSKSAFYTPEIIRCALDIYHQQKKTLDKMKKGAH